MSPENGNPPAGSARYLASFSLTLAVCIGLAFWAASRLESFRDRPIDFYSMSEDTLVIVNGLTRRQSAFLKIGFAETHPPPPVGVFGNHQFHYFSSRAFGLGLNSKLFFNFTYANLGLPEVRDYLQHLANRKQLPTKLVIVQITTPNNDNGQFILGYNGELPASMVQYPNVTNTAELVQVLLHKYKVWRAELVNRLSYSTFIFGLLGGGDRDRILSRSACEDSRSLPTANSRFLRILPIDIRNAFMIGDSRKYCYPEIYWGSAIQPDGSKNAKFAKEGPLVKNENPLDPNKRFLRFGDDRTIANYMQEISQIVAGSGARVVFVVPPVFESNRESIVDSVFTKALTHMPKLSVIDHRKLEPKKSYFINYDHPGPEYFQYLVSTLRKRGYLE